MTYEDFLQVPYKFLGDLELLLEIKKKWGMLLTEDEKILRRHYYRYKLERMARLEAQGIPCHDLKSLFDLFTQDQK